MAKTKTTFFCQNCGSQFSKWQGQCTSCKEWNTIVEEVIRKEEAKAWSSPGQGLVKQSNKPRLLDEIGTRTEMRIDLGNEELNRVLGGGLVPGSLTLLGGEPGIGKSTLLLQVLLSLNLKSLYVSG